MIDQVTFTPGHWRQFWTNYRDLPHQQEAVELLRQHIRQSDPGLLTDSAEWVSKWREREPAPVDFPNTWEGVEAAARVCGARWPQLVAAQWALESARGTAVSGTHNYFGLKGSGSNKSTQEFVDGRWVTITAGFLNFPCLKDCVEYLVKRWYLDYKGYKGVNHAQSAVDAANELRRQGYATDPAYPQKLIHLMNQHEQQP